MVLFILLAWICKPEFHFNISKRIREHLLIIKKEIRQEEAKQDYRAKDVTKTRNQTKTTTSGYLKEEEYQKEGT